MSDPATNIQIEDVLSSIRRLVSEEIGQQPSSAPIKLKKKVEEDAKLVLSPAQKVREDAAEQGQDLWNETEDLAPKEAAPVWWHRDMSKMASLEMSQPLTLDQPVVEAPEPVVQADPVGIDAPETMDVANDIRAPLEGAFAGLEAVKDIHDDEWESPEGAENLDTGVAMEAMPWQGDEDVDQYVAEDEAVELAVGHKESPEVLEDEPSFAEAPRDETAAADDAPFSFRPGERLFERLNSKKMSASHLPDVETVDAAVAEAPEHVEPIEVEPEPEIDLQFDVNESTSLEDELDHDDPLSGAEMSNIFDEDMLRDMVKDIIRQELQGVLGERITRNVRKLVRRELQRAVSDINS